MGMVSGRVGRRRSRGPSALVRLPLRKRLAFTLVLVAPPLLALVALARPAPPPLDYGDTWRLPRNPDNYGPGGLLQEGLDIQVTDGLGGAVRWVNNPQGFRHEAPTLPAVQPGTRRVLSLGDSFAAGYRTAQDATYSARLETALNRRGIVCDVPIACIEQPAIGLAWWRRYGASWHPDVVLLGICTGNDIGQAAASAGQPAFDMRMPAAVCIGAGRPRGFGPPFGLAAWLRDPTTEVRDAFDALDACLVELRDAVEATGARFVVGVWPMRFQADPREWPGVLAGQHLRLDAFDIDAATRTIASRARAHGITVVDPLDAFREAAVDGPLYLPNDMHWNADGHRVAAAALLPVVAQLLQGP